jgi:hypothetical protein
MRSPGTWAAAPSRTRQRRTYYSDGAGNEFFWGDITNNHLYLPTTVEVN